MGASAGAGAGREAPNGIAAGGGAKSTLAYVRNLHDALTYEELTERLLRVSIQNRTSKNLTVDAKSFRGVFAELARAAGLVSFFSL